MVDSIRMQGLAVRLVTGLSGPAVVARPVREGAAPSFAGHEAASGFTGAAGTACEIFAAEGRLLLLGVGDGADPLAWEQAGALAAARLARVAHITLDARDQTPAHVAAMAAGACLRAWQQNGPRARPDEDAPILASLDLLTTDPDAEELWNRAAAGIAGTLFARDLATEPANTLTPQGFSDRLRTLTAHGIAVEIIDAAALEEAGFGCLLAVGQGSVHPPCLAVLRWRGTLDQAPVAFVGKGITFDTGGICIKPADGMWEMKGDMGGAAACAGAMLSLALRQSPAPAIAILAIAENATGAASYRPGDVLRSLSGLTVQVVDTDAEGRLVLADALTYALRQKPCAVIDLATLTGSMVTALGHHMAGLLGNDAVLAASVSAAGAAVGERVWHMPIGESHRRALDSDIADIKHCVDERMQPDGSQAAAFLGEFIEAAEQESGFPTPWAHLDIAGVERRDEADDWHPKGATGFGARLLDRLVADRFEDR